MPPLESSKTTDADEGTELCKVQPRLSRKLGVGQGGFGSWLGFSMEARSLKLLRSCGRWRRQIRPSNRQLSFLGAFYGSESCTVGVVVLERKEGGSTSTYEPQEFTRVLSYTSEN